MSDVTRRGVLGGSLALGGTTVSGGMLGEAVAASSLSSGGVVRLPEGQIQGLRVGAIHVFKGIPYAAAPIGLNRFQPPQPPEPWSGIRAAVRYGASAPQAMISMTPPGVAPMTQVLGWGTDQVQSEDCLFLNVWTPALDGRKRPVMFRIHGGAFTGGSGSWPQSDGAAVAHQGDVVVVTVNHRLGVLGFLHLADLGNGQFAQSANLGMQDLVVALRWVRTNIALFGGDPDEVMIFGESGGGAKVGTLLAMPDAKGLFRRAVIESGPMLRAFTPVEAAARTRACLDTLGIAPDQIDRIRSMPTAELLKSNALGLAGPVVDGRILPAHPGDALAAGAAADIPLLIGTNQTERSLRHLIGLPADDVGVRDRLKPILGEATDRIVTAYRRAWPTLPSGDLLLYVEADHWMRIDSIRLAERQIAGSTAPVYMYLLAWRSHALDGRLKAVHGLEVPLTMNNPQTAEAISGTPGGAALAARMSGAWSAFARTGDPNTEGLPEWPRYTLDRRETMIFDNDSRVVGDPFGERDAWAGFSGRTFW